MKYLIFIIFFIVFSKITIAEEYTCKCTSYKIVGADKKPNENYKHYKRTKCISSKIKLEYEEGYIAIILENGNVLSFDITAEKPKYVKAESIEDKKNYTKIHFNKKSNVF